MTSLDARPARASSWIVGIVTFAFSLAIYLATLAPSVGPLDSGELTVAAWGLGVAHPPGFPLYVLLAHLASLAPLGDVAQRVNLFSALCGAMTAGVMSAIVLEVAPPTGATVSQARSAIVDEWRRGFAAHAVAVVGGLVFATTRTFWSYATVAEVYALNLLLVTVTLFCVLKWRRGAGGSLRRPWLRGAAVSFGLALAVHPLSALFVAPALVYFVWTTAARTRRAIATTCVDLLGVCVGPLMYLLLPVAAWREPALSWGDVRTLDRWWDHVTGAQFQGGQFVIAGAIAESRFTAWQLLRELPAWLSPVAGVLTGVGCWALRGDRRLCRTLVIWVGTALLVPILIGGMWLGAVAAADSASGAEDKNAYYLPAITGLVLLSLAGGVRLLSQAGRARAAVGVAAAILLMAAALSNAAFDNRRHDFLARDYVLDVLQPAQPGSLLLTRDWHLSSPLMYLQKVEGLRLDVEAVDLQLLRLPWYMESLQRTNSVFDGARSEVAAYQSLQSRWYELDDSRRPAMAAALRQAYYDLITRMISARLLRAPVYVTREVVSGVDGFDHALAERLSGTFAVVPQGLVFELRGRQQPPPALIDLELTLPGVIRPSRRFDDNDPVYTRLQAAYREMLYARGLFLMASGERTRSRRAFQQALEIDPSFEPARTALTGMAP